MDLAVELSRVTDVNLSTRSGAWVLERAGDQVIFFFNYSIF